MKLDTDLSKTFQLETEEELKELRPYLSSIRNLLKIPNVDVFASKHEYLMYHLYIAQCAIPEQLLEVTDLNRTRIVTSLNKAVKLGFVSTHKLIYMGVPTNLYYLTSKGIDRIEQILEVFDDDYNLLNFKGKPSHFLESNELYFSAFSGSYSIEIEKEKAITLDDLPGIEFLRADTVMNISYGDYQEKFIIEHDRGTGRRKVIEEKLNYGYAIKMLDEEPLNIVFTISKEGLMTESRYDDVLKNKILKKRRRVIRKLKNMNDLMRDFGQSNIDSFLDLVERSLKIENDDNPSNIILRKNAKTLKSYLEIRDQFEHNTRTDILASISLLKDELDILKDSLLYSRIERYEHNRVDSIKNLILEMSSEVEIPEETYKSLKSTLVDYAKVVNDKVLISSFKKSLYGHEMLIGSMSVMKEYFKNRVTDLCELDKYVGSLFNRKIKNPKKAIIDFRSGDHVWRKSLNSYILEDELKREGYIVFEPAYNLADRMKLELIKTYGVEHSLDSVYFVVLDKDGEVIDRF